ncbi:universal stress protein [Halomicrobium urmianum]|uniref:universal stress protein n=1 Tax=Halomicrobium urmianum TaxID=1586233 RepID=UPI001CD9B753|nr:universal stress protein [Halomicrobium urmianum]
MYDRLLLPTDGSEEMEGVIEHAAGLAREHDAALHAVYVVDEGAAAGVPMAGAGGDVRGMLAERGEEALDDVAAIAGDALAERTILDGTPWREIVDYADERDVDLIAMGTHGRGGIDRLLLGSVAERVVRRSPVPVLTVRVERSEE